MNDPRPAVPLEQLLVHREWVRALARTLVRDEHRADDVEQQAWLAAIERPPRHAGSIRAWLSEVVRNAARKTHRGDVRRERHETAASAPESSARGGSRAGADLVAEAELQHVLTRAVLDLDEPYRATVLFRWFDGLAPRDVAARMGVPVETVRTRLRRAHEQLRERLDGKFDDGRGGGRAAWTALILAWPDPAAAPLAPTPPGPGIAASPGIPLTGAIVMSGLGKVAAAVAAVALVAGGVWTWATDAPGRAERGAPAIVEDGHAAPTAQPTRSSRAGTTAPAAPPARETAADDASGVVDVLVRASTGAPIEGAIVEVHAMRARLAGAVDEDAYSSPAATPSPTARTTTGADGIAHLAGLPRDRSAQVIARRAGFATAGLRITPGAADAPPRAEIVLVAGHTLAGRVVTPSGSPVAHAAVLAGDATARFGVGRDPAPLLARGTADADGRFALAGLSRGTTHVFAAHPGGPVVPVALVAVPDIAEVVLVLPEAASASGTVRDATTRAAIAGALVSVHGYLATGSGGVTTATDAEGRWRVDGLPFESARVVARAAGYVRESGAVPQTPLRAGAAVTVDLTLRRGATVAGVIRGGGAPVARARVTVAWAGDAYAERASAATGADGRFSVDGVPPGRATVVVSADGWFQEGFPRAWTRAVQTGNVPASAVVAVPETGTVACDVDLARGASVSGRVFAPDGTPIGGAEVHAAYDDDEGFENDGPWRVATATTAADGTFVVSGIGPAPRVRIVASHPRHASNHVALELPAADAPAPRVEIRLLTKATIRGRVTSPAGAELAGAVVESTTMAIGGGAAADEWAWAWARRTPVGPDGRFEVEIAQATSNVSLRATAPGFPPSPAVRAAVTPDARAPEVTLTLAAGRSVLGRVTNAATAAPIAGARVRLVAADARADTHRAQAATAAPQVAVTDATGEFTLRALGDGTWELVVEADHHRAAKLRFDVPFRGLLDLALAPTLSLRGRTTLADGSPAAGVSVAVAISVAESGQPEGRSTKTNADGMFELADLEDRPHAVSFGAFGSAAAANVLSRVVEGLRPGPDVVTVVLDPALAIAGRVVDAEGKAVGGAWVGGTGEGSTRNALVPGIVTGDDGAFVLRGLAPGAYRISAGEVPYRRTNRRWRPSTPQVVDAGAAGVVLVLREGLSISGRVVDGSGRPLASGSVEAWYVRDGASGEASGDAYPGGPTADIGEGGAFVVTGLDAARYRLVLADGSGTPTRLQIATGATVEAGAAGLRLIATAGATITGRVTLGPDAPLEGVGVSATRVGDPRRSISGQTDSSGAFVLLGAEPGATYDLCTSVLGLVQGRAKGVAGGAADVRLRCERGLKVRGRVTDRDGAPVAKVHLAFANEALESYSSCVTAADGTFEAGGLVEGEHRVRFESFPKQPDGSVRREWRDCGSVRAGDERAELRIAE